MNGDTIAHIGTRRQPPQCIRSGRSGDTKNLPLSFSCLGINCGLCVCMCVYYVCSCLFIHLCVSGHLRATQPPDGAAVSPQLKPQVHAGLCGETELWGSVEMELLWNLLSFDCKSI